MRAGPGGPVPTYGSSATGRCARSCELGGRWYGWCSFSALARSSPFMVVWMLMFSIATTGLGCLARVHVAANNRYADCGTDMNDHGSESPSRLNPVLLGRMVNSGTTLYSMDHPTAGLPSTQLHTLRARDGRVVLAPSDLLLLPLRSRAAATPSTRSQRVCRVLVSLLWARSCRGRGRACVGVFLG